MLAARLPGGGQAVRGQLAGRLKDMRLSGNIYDLLGKQLVDLSIECPETIHNDQRAPWVLLREVTVS